MEDKKPCDDIFEGLAELLINTGEVTANHYTRDRRFGHGVFNLCTSECWSVDYGDYVYLIDTTDGEVVSIQRVKVHKYDESEDE